MNKIDYTHAIKILTAANAGKIVQFKNFTYDDNRWDISNINTQYNAAKLHQLNDPGLYRVAPEIEYVPLGSEDIPPVCWINTQPKAIGAMLVSTIEATELATNGVRFSYEDLHCNGYYYSEDRKNWKLCRKEKV